METSRQRESISVRLYDQTLAATNQILVVIEERIAIPIYHPASFIYIDYLGAAVTAAQS